MKINYLKLITLVVVLAMTLSFCGCKRMNVLNDASSDVTSTDSEYTASTVITQTSTPDKSTSSTVSIEQPSTSTPEYPTTSGTTSTTTPTTSTPSTSTPSSPTTSTPSTPSTTPSTPSDSTSDDAGLEGKDWFYKTYLDGTTGEEVQCRCYYVTIGQRQFIVNYDAVYGVCNKCGLNNQTIHLPVTCPHCSKTICAAAYVNTTTDIFTCPYCLTEIDDNTFIELLS